jgi:hypothetical protein
MKCGWLSASALVVGTALLAHGDASAADSASVSQGAGKSTGAADTAEVTLQADRVPAKFRGLPLAQFIAALEKRRTPAKGEFETSEAFQQRLGRSVAGTIVGGATADDTLIFVVSPTSNENAESGVMYSYEADAGATRVYLRHGKMGNFLLSDDLSSYTRLTVDERKTSSDSYVASNAFGATMRVARHFYYGIGLAVAGEIPRLDLSFDLPAKVASREIPAMKVAMFVKLRDVTVAREEVQDPPTRDSPTDIITRSKYLKVDLLGYMAFSGIDGRVFGSTNPRPAAP